MSSACIRASMIPCTPARPSASVASPRPSLRPRSPEFFSQTHFSRPGEHARTHIPYGRTCSLPRVALTPQRQTLIISITPCLTRTNILGSVFFVARYVTRLTPSQSQRFLVDNQHSRSTLITRGHGLRLRTSTLSRNLVDPDHAPRALVRIVYTREYSPLPLAAVRLSRWGFAVS